jgi:hypothetical protein
MLTILKNLGILRGSTYDMVRHGERLELTEHANATSRGPVVRRHTRFPQSHVRETPEIEPESKPRLRPKKASQSHTNVVATRSRLNENATGSLYSEEPIGIDTLRRALPTRFAVLDSDLPDQ